MSLCTPLILALLAAAPADLDALVERVTPDVVAWRRAIHAHPELGERETRTAALVAERLRELGLEVREGVAVTGVVGVLRGGAAGPDSPVVAWRADMDALPVTEQTGLPYASTRTDEWDGEQVGVMHACGHDMHVAIGLGIASVLASPEVRESLAGTVVFLFQPAEEGMPGPEVHGAERMLAEGALADPRPEAVLGLHVNPLLGVGQVSVIPGGALAAVDRFRIRVKGVQTHGAYPQAGVDPIVTASQIVLALQTIASRNVDTRESVVVSVGKIEAGNRFNIIPGEAELLGTIRTHDEDVRATIHRRMEEIAANVAVAMGATAETEIESITPATVNDPELVERLLPAVRAAVGDARVVPEKPHMGGEDFAFLANEVPGLYFFLGVTDPAEGVPAMVHTPFFAPSEKALPVGVRTGAGLLLELLAP